MRKPIVGIFGLGRVGTAVAFSLLNKKLPSELVLIGSRPAHARAERDDLLHSLGFLGASKIHQGYPSDLRHCDFVIISARNASLAAAYRDGRGREVEALTNIQMIRELSPSLNPRSKMIIVSNPVELLLSVLAETEPAFAANAIGIGTLIDTERFRHALSLKFRVRLNSVKAQVIGSHDSHMVPLWSQARVAGTPVKYDAEVEGKVRHWGLEIAQEKGSTWWAVAAGVCQIVEALLRKRTVLTLSNYLPKQGLSLSLPTRVSPNGIETLVPDLSPAEESLLAKCIAAQRAGVESGRASGTSGAEIPEQTRLV